MAVEICLEVLYRHPRLSTASRAIPTPTPRLRPAMTSPTPLATAKEQQAPTPAEVVDLGNFPLIRFSLSTKLGFLSSQATSAGTTAPLDASLQQSVSGLFSLPIGASGTVRASLVGAADVYVDTSAYSTGATAQSGASLEGVLMTYEVGHWEAQPAVKLVGRVYDASGNARVLPSSIHVQITAPHLGSHVESCSFGADGVTEDCSVSLPPAWLSSISGSVDADVKLVKGSTMVSLGHVHLLGAPTLDPAPAAFALRTALPR